MRRGISAVRSGRLVQPGVGVIAMVIFVLAFTSSALAEVTGAADNLRTGWYPDEASLTPALLSGGGFQQVFNRSLQGQIYAQPLAADGTLLVATENNWVYGLDPNLGTVRWEKQFGTPVEASKPPIECPDLAPNIGITGTPVIDTERNIAYFVSNRYASGSSGPIAWYMHAIELGSGNEVTGFPVPIEGKAENLPGVKFEAAQELQRPALLMMNGVVYAAFGSHCDKGPFEGWVIGVSTSGLLTTRWATARKGGSIWQAGAGLISDGPGQVLFATGNGSGITGEGDPTPGPGKTPPSELSESVVRVAVQPGGGLRATDFFSPFNNAALDEEDLDLGSAGPIALPSQYFGTPSAPDLLVQPSKKGDLYLLNRDELGGMGQGPGGTDKLIHKLGPYGGVWDGSAVWPGDGGYVYIPGVAPAGTGATEGGSDNLRFFKYGVEQGEPTLSLAATSLENFAFGSGAPIVTSNSTASGTGILWTTQCSPKFAACKEAKLRAYGAVPVAGAPHELWSAPIGQATKFSRPDASNGHIYVGNREGHIFGYGGPGALTPSTASLEFATAPVGDRVARQVTFTNTGTQLEVSAVRPPSAPFEATGLPPVGTIIAPGQVITVEVALRSPAAGSFTGSLGLTTQAGEANVALSGSVEEPPPTVTAGAPSSTQSPATLNATVSPGIAVLPSQEHSAPPVPDAKLASASLTARSSGTVSVNVSCPARESSCTGTLTLRTLSAVIVGHQSGKPKAAILALATGSFTVAGGQTATVRLHLSATARKLLARIHVLRALATIVAHDARGATQTSRMTVTIRAAKARHRR